MKLQKPAELGIWIAHTVKGKGSPSLKSVEAFQIWLFCNPVDNKSCRLTLHAPSHWLYGLHKHSEPIKPEVPAADNKLDISVPQADTKSTY